MELKQLENAIISKYDNDFKASLKKIETEEGLTKALEWENKQYKGDVKKKFIRYLTRERDKRQLKDLHMLEAVANAKEFNGELVITVEWKKSAMWGNNPTASTNYGFIGTSISGCGYDKLSTATAEALNSDFRILKLLYEAKNKALKKNPKIGNHECLGYGSGYNMLPSFEGGVGVESHKKILKNIGLEMKTITSTKTVDVYLITTI